MNRDLYMFTIGAINALSLNYVIRTLLMIRRTKREMKRLDNLEGFARMLIQSVNNDNSMIFIDENRLPEA